MLETVAPMRTNTGAPIKEAVDLASSVTRDTEVKRFLARSLKHFKGNAAGTTKHAALWLAAQALTLTLTRIRTLTLTLTLTPTRPPSPPPHPSPSPSPTWCGATGLSCGARRRSRRR